MTVSRVVRLAVVDDSLFVRKAISRLFEGDERILIVGVAASGEELLANLQNWRPTAVTLDLSMPGMGGLATLDELMRRRPVPVIVLSAHTSQEAPLTIEALNRGAVDFVDKQQYSLVDFDALRSVLGEKLLNISGVPRPAPLSAPPPPACQPRATRCDAFEMLLIGASTGGPPAIEQILREVGAVDVPIAIVQHMPVGFTAAFASRLNAHLPIEVREAAHGTPFAAGVAHVAPAGLHLRLKREGERLITVLARHPEETVHRPSVDVLFGSAEPFAPRVLAILLTGMGDDGARGLSTLAAAGAHTIAQDEATSIVYGMPRAALSLGAVCEQLPLPLVGRRVGELLRGSG